VRITAAGYCHKLSEEETRPSFTWMRRARYGCSPVFKRGQQQVLLTNRRLPIAERIQCETHSRP
jgi:hypothetical protein